MAEKKRKKQEEQLQQADEASQNTPPPGVKLLRTLEGHQGRVLSVVFDPQGGTLASC